MDQTRACSKYFFLAVNARWERDKDLVPVVRACVEFYWNLGKIVFFGIF